MVLDELNDFFVTPEIVTYAHQLYYEDLITLYHPDLYVIPMAPDGEIEREMLYNDYDISRYGCNEYTFNYNDNLYTAILVNND